MSKVSYFNIVLDILEIVFISTAIFVVVFLFAAQLLEVNGDSMVPTFHNGEQLIVEKVSIKVKPVQRGEIIIFEHPKEPNRLLIKRVIGLPGEKISIKNGHVYINEQQLSEPYLGPGVITEGKAEIMEDTELVIPADSYVLIGDNRAQSTDSRDWGVVQTQKLIGRGFLVYAPKESFRFIN